MNFQKWLLAVFYQLYIFDLQLDGTTYVRRK